MLRRVLVATYVSCCRIERRSDSSLSSEPVLGGAVLCARTAATRRNDISDHRKAFFIATTPSTTRSPRRRRAIHRDERRDCALFLSLRTAGDRPSRGRRPAPGPPRRRG